MYAKAIDGGVELDAVQLEGFVEVEGTLPDVAYRDAWRLIGNSVVIDGDAKNSLDHVVKKADRDNALDSLTHDFLDGRIMQVRPKDEQNVRNAIEMLEATGTPSRQWVMEDNTKYETTLEELKAALLAGQLAAAAIWDAYEP